MAKKKKGKGNSNATKSVDPSIEIEQLIQQYDVLEKQITAANVKTTDLSKEKASLVLNISKVEVELKNSFLANAAELEKYQKLLENTRQEYAECLSGQSEKTSSLAIDLATKYELRKGIESLYKSVDDKKKIFELNKIQYENEVKQFEDYSFTLRMQLTEASRQQLKEVNGGLEARTVEYVESTSKEASIRNKSLEEELFHHSKEVVNVMDQYDETEVKLVKLRRQRELKRSALALVHERMRKLSDKALEYGSIVHETSSQIIELETEIQQINNIEKELNNIEQIKMNIENVKFEAISNAQKINDIISRIRGSGKLRSGIANKRKNKYKEEKEEEKDDKLSSTNMTSKNIVQNNKKQVFDEAEIDAIWYSGAVKMSDVSWS